MKPPNFRYLAASSVEEVVDLLAEHGEEARVLAGGQSLVQEMNARRVEPNVLIDVNPVAALGFVRRENGSIAVGALTRTVEVERDAAVAERLAVLREAAARVGHVAVRNRGTVGGNLAYADPAGNLAPVMLALDAEVVARGREGSRTIAATDFFLGPHQNALAPTELLTEVRLRLPPEGTGSAFVEVSRRDRGWGVAGVAAVVTLDGEGVISEARIGLSGVGPTALRTAEAEEAVLGERPAEETWKAAADAAVGSLDAAPSDVHASADYRRHLAGVLVRRTLAVAADRAERRG